MKAANVCLIGLVFIVSASAEPLLEGQVRLESGEPVADAQVRIFDMSDLRQGAIARALTDGTGYFALPLAALGGQALPARFALGPNYPNPFNPSTIIPYQLAASAAVRLEVFNLLGQRITTLVDGERPAGFHTATWHAVDGAGRAVGAGVYIYRMMVGAEIQTGRMVLIDGQAGVSAGGSASVMPGASDIGGSDGEGAQVYGLIVSGSGLVPYVDSSFRVEAGMAPVELVVSSGQHSAGKVTDDDCAFCELFGVFNDQQEEEEADETPEEEEEDETPEEEEEEDLIVSASVSDNSLTPGQVFTLRARVQNQGTDAFQDLVLSYYRSSDVTISTQDMLLGTDEVGSLAASSTSGDESISLTASSTSGTYYYGACVASASDESDTPNYCSTGVRVVVADEEDLVSIPDANLRAAIAAALGKASGATITVAEMKTLNRLHAVDQAISDLTGLEFASNLKYLYLSGNNISDISALSGLTDLAGLVISENNISDISALSGLTKLTRLDLSENNISDISVLSGLTNLFILGLSGNNISEISALSGLTKLIGLVISGNNISDISALSDLTNLTGLDLSGNNISDISALSGLTKLTGLDLSGNNISDISVLSGLTNLRELELNENNISDISALSGLTDLKTLFLTGNNISDISALSGLTKLTRLYLSENNISDISALSSLTNLSLLDFPWNNISDISALSGLTELGRLVLIGNNISDISALSSLTKLGFLDLRINPLNASSINDHIPALKSRGARVFFDSFRIEQDDSDFDIELVFLSHFTEGQKREIQYAARRWMSIIRGDLPEYTFTQGWSGTCGDHSFEIPAGERIDDLRIYITSYDDDSDGNPGWGGPSVLRETSHLSVVGCMSFNLSYNSVPLSTALHEIGHVLGFGTLWDAFGFLQNPSRNNPNADTHFNGPLAIAAFNDAGGWDYAGAKVPVLRQGGPGSVDSHWRNSVFEGGELMRSGQGNGVLSAITIQSLADLGYSVDVTQADSYTLPSAAAKASAKITAPPTHAEPELSCGVGQEREPMYVVDPQGRIIRTLGD